MENHDVIVVGCGTGGAIASKICSIYNLDVVAIDTKSKQDIGKKVCGDAITGIYFEMLKKFKIDKPKGEELSKTIEGLKIFGHDKKHCLDIKNDVNKGYMLNRHAFGQRLVEDTINTGTKLYDNYKVISLIVEANQLIGVKILNNKTEEKKDIFAKIIIDAGGYSAPIRRKLDLNTPGLEKEINKRDIEICYREIRKFKTDESALKLFVDVNIAPGGYMWIFPKSNEVNLGVGIQGNISKNVKKAYQEFLNAFEDIKNSELIHGGGGVVPVRHPIDSLVSNGLMLVGDSGSQVNPMHGGGIGFSMRAGALAAKHAFNAIKKGKYDYKTLWSYNYEYMLDIGAKQASLEVLKLLLQTLSNKQIDYVFRKKLFTSEELMAAVERGTFKISFFKKIKKLITSIRHIKLLKKLTKIAKLMKRAMEIYQKYPKDPSKFSLWKKEQSTLFEEVYDLCNG